MKPLSIGKRCEDDMLGNSLAWLGLGVVAPGSQIQCWICGPHPRPGLTCWLGWVSFGRRASRATGLRQLQPERARKLTRKSTNTKRSCAGRKASASAELRKKCWAGLKGAPHGALVAPSNHVHAFPRRKSPRETSDNSCQGSSEPNTAGPL